MELSAYIFTETLRAVCNLTLFFDISARLMFWFGAEHTGTGEFLRSVSDLISFPFRKLLSKFVLRHPFFEGLPGMCGTALIYTVMALLP